MIGECENVSGLIIQTANVTVPRGFKGLKQAIKLEIKLRQYDKVRTFMS